MRVHLPRTTILLFVFCLSLFTAREGRAQALDGKSLFQTNCAQCHNPISVVVGPALKGVTQRVPDSNLLHAWIHNNATVLRSGNVYFNNLFNQYGRAPMNTFPGLTNGQIDAILNYVETYAQPLGSTNTSNYPNATQEDHTVLYGICTFILALFVFGLHLVNNSLKRLADEKKGLPPPYRVPFYRNKFYIATTTIIVMILLGWWLTAAGIGLGRQQGYQPEQPIFFSHRVHAGLNQISCLLCHGNAWDSKQASVPSLNFCMNCHAAITVYHGERLTREDGSPVDPNQEIQKLFEYTGYDPAKGRYTRRESRWNGSASTICPTSSSLVMRSMCMPARSNVRPVMERFRKWMRSTSSRRSAWAGASIATGPRAWILPEISFMVFTANSPHS